MEQDVFGYQQIFNELFVGNTVRMNFANKRKANNFRINLTHFKKRQDLELEKNGATIVADRSALRCLFITNPDTGVVTAVMSFVDRAPRALFTVEIIDPTEGNEKIPGDLGTDKE